MHLRRPWLNNEWHLIEEYQTSRSRIRFTLHLHKLKNFPTFTEHATLHFRFLYFLSLSLFLPTIPTSMPCTISNIGFSYFYFVFFRFKKINYANTLGHKNTLNILYVMLYVLLFLVILIFFSRNPFSDKVLCLTFL